MPMFHGAFGMRRTTFAMLMLRDLESVIAGKELNHDGSTADSTPFSIQGAGDASGDHSQTIGILTADCLVCLLAML